MWQLPDWVIMQYNPKLNGAKSHNYATLAEESVRRLNMDGE